MAHPSTLEEWATWAFAPSWSVILTALIVVLSVPILLHLWAFRKAAAKEAPTFLLVGPSGAGKTSLLTLVCTTATSSFPLMVRCEREALVKHGLSIPTLLLQFSNSHPSPTHTSSTPTSALCTLPSSAKTSSDQYRSEHDISARTQPSFLLLDTPGHGKLRHHALSSLSAPSALKGLVFVVDSAAVSSAQGLTETAEYLHDILLVLQKRHTQSQAKSSSSGSSSSGVPVLVAANKQDVFTSLPPALVKTKLEEEIGRVRVTRSKGLMDSGVGMDDDLSPADGVGDEVNWLGEYGSQRFGFGQMEESGVEVRVVGGNVRGEGSGGGERRVEGWWDWVGACL